MKRLAIATAIGSLIACGGCGGSSTAPTPPASIAGTYNASITASSTCSASLPSTTRALNYGAEVSQNGAAVQVQLNAHGGNTVTVSGTVSGQTVTFPSFSLSGSTPQGGAVAVVASGTTANVGADGLITGPLSGTFQAGSATSCNATDHQMQMKRCVTTCSGTNPVICSCQ
jgi:hypothetical protein